MQIYTSVAMQQPIRHQAEPSEMKSLASYWFDSVIEDSEPSSSSPEGGETTTLWEALSRLTVIRMQGD